MFRTTLLRAARTRVAATVFPRRALAALPSRLPAVPTVPASPVGVRRYSTPHGDPAVDPSIAVRDLTDSEYHDLADADMDILHEGLEVLCEEYAPGDDWEVEYSSGVMTLSIPAHGTYVINKQPPNHQIWVSSPVSGPARFSLSPDGVWVHHRQAGVQLGRLLDGELKQFLKDAGTGEEWEGTGLK